MGTIRAADKTKPDGVRCPFPFELSCNVSIKSVFFFYLETKMFLMKNRT